MNSNIRRGLLGTLFAGGLLALGATAANADTTLTTGDIAAPASVTDANVTVLETGTGVLGDGGVLGNDTTGADASVASLDTGAFVDGVAVGGTSGTGVAETGAIAVPVTVTDASATILETGTNTGTGVLGDSGVLGNE
ncbi:hypothetical protein J7E82_16485, partial [Arthrobacter sp. ISL-30]|nr:hypothetical protein [Arthrobacter sp. ISL-30]